MINKKVSKALSCMLLGAMVFSASSCTLGTAPETKRESLATQFPTYGNDEMMIGVFSSPPPTQEAYNECAEAGFTYVLIDQNYASIDAPFFKTIMEYCYNAGMDAYPMTFNTNNATDFMDVPGYAGKFIWDEPSQSNIDTIAEMIESFEAQNGTDKLFFNNLFPYFAKGVFDTYENYINDYVTKVLNKLSGKKLLSIDIYPLDKNGRGDSIIGLGYLYNLEVSAQAALGTDIDVSYFVQTHGHWDHRDLESVADIRFQYNVGMAYGVRAFNAFTYPTQTAWADQGQGLVNIHKAGSTYSTTRTPVYDYVKQANLELQEWDNVYLSYTYKGTKAVIGERNKAGYNDNFDMLKYNLEALSNVTEIQATQDTVIGEFEKDGLPGYMITNFVEPSSGKSDKVILTFEKGTKAQVYINGKMVEKKLVDGQLAVTLQAGEGAFVVVI